MLKITAISILMVAFFILGASLNYSEDYADDTIGVCVIHDEATNYVA